MAILTSNAWALPPEIEKALREAPAALYSIEPQPPRLPIHEVCTVWFAQRQAWQTWKRYNGSFAVSLPRRQKPSKPKWGQPGRHRRRKMRLEARRKNAEMAMVRAACERWDPRKQMADLQAERDRQVGELLRTETPKGPLFTP